MARLVMKFGGTSVADTDRIARVARHVKREYDTGHQVAVILSAMAGTTNQLVQWTRDAAPMHDAREYDTVVAAGEQITVGLLAIALQSMGVSARSWLGWQIPIETDGAHAAARIKGIDTTMLEERLGENQVCVIAGFQGLAPNNRIATLGRGGSDTSAVAVAAALNADRCDIYTDVDGVYTTDPRVVPKAQRMPKISYEEMLEMASLGAKVLQTRSVELAMVQAVPLMVRSSFEEPEDLKPMSLDKRDGENEIEGTLVCDEDEIMEQNVVSGIAFSRDEAQVTLRQVADKPGVAAAVFGPLADAGINVDMIVQNISADGTYTDMTFTVPVADYDRAMQVIQKGEETIGYEHISSSTDISKISVIGVGMRSHAGVAAKLFKGLADRGINIIAITTSEIKVSVLIDAAFTELAVRTLHSLYGLDAD